MGTLLAEKQSGCTSDSLTRGKGGGEAKVSKKSSAESAIATDVSSASHALLSVRWGVVARASPFTLSLHTHRHKV